MNAQIQSLLSDCVNLQSAYDQEYRLLLLGEGTMTRLGQIGIALSIVREQLTEKLAQI